MRQGRLISESVASIEAVYRSDGRRIFATLLRLLGSFELAEEAEHDAFIAAAEQWPRDGVPANPVAWLVSVGRFKAIDRLRRDARFASMEDHAHTIEQIPDTAAGQDEQEAIGDDRLRLIFTCCHPSLSEEARIALTLREVYRWLEAWLDAEGVPSSVTLVTCAAAPSLFYADWVLSIAAEDCPRLHAGHQLGHLGLQLRFDLAGMFIRARAVPANERWRGPWCRPAPLCRA